MGMQQGFAITFQWGVCPHCGEMMEGTSELPQVSMCPACAGRLGRRCPGCDEYTILAAPECCFCGYGLEDPHLRAMRKRREMEESEEWKEREAQRRATARLERERRRREAELRRRFNRTAWLKSRSGMPCEEWLAAQRGAEEPEQERVELKVQAPKEWIVREM